MGVFEERVRYYRNIIYFHERRLLGKGAFTRSRLFARFRLTREFGLHGLDSKVFSIIGAKRGFYIEIGANDGVSQSNTLQLELFHGWHGVLIEPVSSTFSSLQKNRNSRRNHLEQAACVGFGYSKDEVELVYSNLMTTPLNLDSDITDTYGHAREGVRFLRREDRESALKIVKAPALTMTSILKKAKAPAKIDLLSLDVEGAELEVLAGIDFEQFSVVWILIESRDIKRIDDFLAPKGYRLHSQLGEVDYLFRLLPSPQL